MQIENSPTKMALDESIIIALSSTMNMVLVQSLVQQMDQMMPYNGTGENTTLLWIIIILLLVIIVYLWFMGVRKNPQILSVQESEVNASKPETIETEKIDVALRLLNDNEKQIVQALIEHGGTMLQKDISNELEMTRVQTHRTIQSLIERDIVTSEDHFNTKKITLADWLIQ